MISKNQAKLVRSLETKKHRQAEGLFVAEGPKVVGDLLACHFRPHIIFSTNVGGANSASPSPIGAANSAGSSPIGAANNASPLPCPIVHVTDDELRRISFLQHPQQVLAVFELPSSPGPISPIRPISPISPIRPISPISPIRPISPISPISPIRPISPISPISPTGLSLALDGVQDPGNLGTIIRVADWYGIDTIYCSPDTADCWAPKVVQATMGSIARVRMVYTDLITLLNNAEVPVYGTVLDGDNIYHQQLTGEGIIVMGNEGNGISAPVRQLLTHRLLIPQVRPGAESLNVAIATAIVCSEFRRTLLQTT